jgi:uncharacterized protein with PIN domain
MKLLFDEMLKNLASWCRILGIDSEFFSGKSDSQLLEHAEKSGRVFVTRDFPLSVRCEKHGIRFILIKSDAIEEQIAQVIRETGVKVSFPENTRCATCNGELDVVPKESVKDGLPGNVIANHDTFWRCRSCGKVFWEGGHWKNIRRIYARVKELLAPGP